MALPAKERATMRWCRVQVEDKVRYGIVEDDRVTEVSGSPFESYSVTSTSYALDSVKLLIPATPATFYAAGTNYPEHITWAARKLGREPQIPQKADIGYRAVNALIAHEGILSSPRTRRKRSNTKASWWLSLGRWRSTCLKTRP